MNQSLQGFKLVNNLITKVCQVNPINYQLTRLRHTKHWDPKWKRFRREKVIHVDLSQFEDNDNKDDEMSKEVRRTKMKERGIFPQKPWTEKPMYISCTGNIFEAYVPPEGDGKYSSISPDGAKQNVEKLMKKTKSYQAIKKIKRYEEEFNANDFGAQATETYIQAHTTLANKDKDKLTDYITEKLYPEMLHNIENKIIKWKFIKSLEPPRVVHARCTSMLTETNMFAQVTVRFHTQQLLALYDRFGRLMNGSEILAKDVLEYVVLEKHLSNEYGRWRLHAKIVPSWMPPKPSIEKTFILKNVESEIETK